MFFRETNKNIQRSFSFNFISSTISLIIIIILLFGTSPYSASAQQPTIQIPTVTGTPKGVTATVSLDQDFVNVRTGPGVFYEKIGYLLPGQQVPVKGRSPGGDWLFIEYLGVEGNRGWIYSPNVSLTAGSLAIIEPPPTPTPRVTVTIDPTLAAQFVITPVSTRLPTYTPAEPVEIPTFTDSTDSSIFSKLPMGLVIIVLGGFGIILGIFAFFQNR